MTTLDAIVDALFNAVAKLSPAARSELEQVLIRGNALVELLTFVSVTERPELAYLWTPAIDEIFLDLHLALSLATAGHYKASLVLTRTCAESSLYVLYFVDHPVEARMWAESDRDMSFSRVLDEMATPAYFMAASKRSVSEESLRSLSSRLRGHYRQLSQRVHGKYAFLNVTLPSGEVSLSMFSTIVSDTIKDIAMLIALRVTDVDALLQRYPQVGGIL